MPGVRVQFPDRVPIHAGPPQGMPRQIAVSPIAENLAVDLQIRGAPALLAPQRVLAERAVLRFEVFLPERGWLDDVAVAIEYREVFTRHPPLPISSASIPVSLRGAERRSNLPGRSPDRHEIASLRSQ